MHPNAYLRSLWATTRRPTVFVAMTFGAEYDQRFNEIFVPAIASVTVQGAPLRALRVDASKSGDSILTEIIDGIAHSTLVMADVSTMGRDSKTGDSYRNGNVMYEVGIALACRQPSEVLLVRDDRDKFLFDVSSIPHMTLDFTHPGTAIAAIKGSLEDRLRETSRVFDARVKLVGSKLGPKEVLILREMYQKRGSSYGITADDTNAYARLTSFGILEFLPGKGSVERPAYQVTEFGSATMELLFESSA